MSLKDDAHSLLNDAMAHSDKDDYDGAIEKLNDIVDVGSCFVNALIQRGRCNWEMKRWEKSFPDFQAAQRISPDSPDINWTLSLMALQLNDFKVGWEGNENRWKSEKFDSPRLQTKKPQWELGSSAKEVLVWSEQGIGDQIIYGSLLPELKKHVDVLTAMIDARLIPLFERSMPDITFIAQNCKVKGIDAHIPIGSLPANFIRKMDDIPERVKRGFLKPDESLTNIIRKHINKAPNEIIIGLSWRSGAPRIGNHKSVPLGELTPLFRLPNVRVINLQYDEIESEIENFEIEHGVRLEKVNFIDNRKDLDGFSSLVDACDLVVTCSNATTHVAGAIGKPTFLLDSNKLWYWNNRTGRNSFWYPSVKVFPRDSVVAPWKPHIDEMLSQVKFKIGISPPPTFVFFHVGDDVLIPQKMVDSILMYHPGAEIIMCSDELTPEIQGVTLRVDRRVYRDEIMEARLFAFADLKLDKPAMYIDNDMIFLDYVDVNSLLGTKQIVMCRRSFNRNSLFSPVQRGIDFREYEGKTLDEVYPYLACATITRDYQPWASMYTSLMTFMDEKFKQWYGDQEALRFASVALNSDELGSIDEREYACLPEYASQLNRPRIMHYKGERKKKFFSEGSAK